MPATMQPQSVKIASLATPRNSARPKSAAPAARQPKPARRFLDFLRIALSACPV